MSKNSLPVPWDKIREACEKGTSQVEVAKLFGINRHTIRIRSQREQWATPKRLGQKLDKAARLHDDRVAANNIIAEQLTNQRTVPTPSTLGASSTKPTDFEEIATNYRGAAAEKLYRILTQTVIAPPRTWKDFDIADKMMRRTLGMDDGEGKSNTVVQLQVVNERLRQSSDIADIIEGEVESVTIASPEPEPQSETTGS